MPFLQLALRIRRKNERKRRRISPQITLRIYKCNDLPEKPTLKQSAKTAIERRLLGRADRVLMPLPEKALEYLPFAVSTLKPRGGWVHVHTFERASCAQTAAENVKVKIAEALRCARVDFEFGEVREVRSVGPNWFQIVADTHVLPLSSHLVP